MPGGTSNPPQDPQIYMGYFQLSDDLNIADHSPSTSSNCPPLDTISITVITISYYSSSSADRLSLLLNLCLTKDRDQYHLFSKERKDSYMLGIAQLNSYTAFNCVVCKNLKFRGPAPFTYGCFADLWNNTNHPCGFLLMDADGFWVPERAPALHGLFVAAMYHDPHHQSLRKAKLIKEDGSVDKMLLASLKTAAKICINWQQHNQERIQRQQDARHAKKQARIHGARLIEAQKHAAELYHAHSKQKAHKAHKQHINNSKCDDLDMELNAPLVASTSQTHHKPAINTFPAPTPAPIMAMQTTQFTQLFTQPVFQPAQPEPQASVITPMPNALDATATTVHGSTNITLTELNANPVAHFTITGNHSMDDFIDYEGPTNTSTLKGTEVSKAA